MQLKYLLKNKKKDMIDSLLIKKLLLGLKNLSLFLLNIENPLINFLKIDNIHISSR